MARETSKVLMAPIWLAQVFGQSKSFVSNPIIGNRTLNRMGLHVARLIAAKVARRIRLLTISLFVAREYREQYWRDGFVLVENFLSEDEFERLRNEVLSKGPDQEVRECKQGDTLTHRVLLDEPTLEHMPTVKQFLYDRRFRRICSLVAGSRKQPLHYIQRIANGYVKAKVDPQKTLHSDTFHPTMKAWLFLDDVPEENGPFTYAPGSHRLTKGRLKWEYNLSVNAHELKNKYSQRGSARASDSDLALMGYGPRRAIAVLRNTLVVADTHGFHCRGQAKGKVSRMEIWSYCRTNPFSVISGIGSRIASRIENRAARAIWRHMDAIAERRGKKSSWHMVESSKMFDE